MFCENDLPAMSGGNFIASGTDIHLDSRMNRLEFGQRSWSLWPLISTMSPKRLQKLSSNLDETLTCVTTFWRSKVTVTSEHTMLAITQNAIHTFYLIMTWVGTDMYTATWLASEGVQPLCRICLFGLNVPLFHFMTHRSQRAWVRCTVRWSSSTALFTVTRIQATCWSESVPRTRRQRLSCLITAFIRWEISRLPRHKENTI